MRHHKFISAALLQQPDEKNSDIKINHTYSLLPIHRRYPLDFTMEPRTWHRTDPTTKQTYLISTRRAYIDEDFINASFATEDMHWAQPLPPAALTTMLDNCITLGLYTTTPPTDSDSKPVPAIYSELRQIGLARLITDYVTFAYVTDVYVVPEYRYKGLAAWLVKCCGGVMEDMMEAHGGGCFRNALLVTSNKAAVPMYEKGLDFFVAPQDLGVGPVVMSTKFKKH